MLMETQTRNTLFKITFLKAGMKAYLWLETKKCNLGLLKIKRGKKVELCFKKPQWAEWLIG